MGKLNQEQRQIVGAGCVSAAVANKNKNNVIVYCNDKNAGLAVKGALSAAYPSYEFSIEEVGNGMSTWEWVTNIATGGAWALTSGLTNTWKVFTVKTKSTYNASQLVKEINSCIAEYNYGGVDPENYGGGDDPYTPYNGGSGTGSGTQKKDYTTYIIIGAALAVIVLLLLWKKK